MEPNGEGGLPSVEEQMREANARIAFEGEGYRSNPVDGNCRL